MNLQPISFISDLHLSSGDLKRLEAFEFYCQDLSVQFQKIFILGDLFEYWIGSDVDALFQTRVLNALSAASKNTQVYFLRGNREILIPKSIIESTGCIWLDDFSAVKLFGKNFVMCHGDRLCSNNKSHQHWLKLTCLLQALPLTSVPLKFRLWCLKKLQKPNRKPLTTNNCIDQKQVINLIHKHKAHYFIHGHTHVPEITQKHATKTAYTYISLPSWDDQPCHFFFEADGSMTVENFR